MVRARLALILSALTAAAVAQNSTGGLRGQVADPSAAVIPGAQVSVSSPDGHKTSAVTDGAGAYEIKGLAPGAYTVSVSAKNFVPASQPVQVVGGKTQQLDFKLEIQVEKQEVEVQEETPTLDVSPENNASAIVIKGKDLDALSDDPDELAAELQALAGPSAGPNGGQIYIDGFTGGQLPPKSSIREIRINQNPFSAEYDKLGYGRIEIFTKPGTDKFHGQVSVMGNDSAFNSLNPFVTSQPGYSSELYNANLGGPITKTASFFFNVERRDIDDTSIINAVILNPNFTTGRLTQAISAPRVRTNITPRFDFQLGKDNTLTVRYQLEQERQDNNGIGQFSLPSQAYNVRNTEQALQLSDTQTFGAHVVNETRFQYIRERNNELAQDFAPTVSVLGAFTGGGNSLGFVNDKQDRYELQNYTSIAHGNHVIKFGGRLRATRDANDASSDFNGVFTFSSLAAYRITQQGLQQGLTPAQIRAAGGGADQFSITSGTPSVVASLFDAGLYIQDDWRLRPNLTLSSGLRFESQNDIHDHADFGPRLALAWGLGGAKNRAPKTVLRAGYGLFYDRFGSGQVLQAERLNGINEDQTIVAQPNFFPAIPSVASLVSSQVSPTIYQINRQLRAPVTYEAAFSVERQLTKSSTVALTYLNSRGEHQLLVYNANAPLPGTVDPAIPGSGVRPLGNTTNLYQYDSEGIFKQNQLIANINLKATSRISVFGYYTLNYANSDLGAGGLSGSPGFVSNSYDFLADYGRASFDIHHRFVLGSTISLPDAIRLNPFILVNSGQPYNITLGQDLNGDSVFNDRPAFANGQTLPQDVRATPLGDFDRAPTPGEGLVPINYGTGPTLFTLNLRVSKSFGFGREVAPNPAGQQGSDGRDRRGGGMGGPGFGGAGERGGMRGGGGGGGGRGGFGGGPGSGPGENQGTHRYNLTLSANARNLLNRQNLGTPVGNLQSPLFAESNALAGPPFSSGSASRRIDLQLMFSF